jgi:hypothetical protein
MPKLCLAVPTCAVQIMPNHLSPNHLILTLAEVTLFGVSGIALPRDSLTFTLSTTLLSNGYDEYGIECCYYVDPGSVASNCNDGIMPSSPVYNLDYSDKNDCATDGGDPWPTLTILYPCPSSVTSLSHVVVYNSNYEFSYRKENINNFSLVFLNAWMDMDGEPYLFTGSLASYTVPYNSKCTKLQKPESVPVSMHLHSCTKQTYDKLSLVIVAVPNKHMEVNGQSM